MEQQSLDDSVSLVIGTPIHRLTWMSALTRLQEWAVNRESRYVCICNVHSVVTARRDIEFSLIIREADMATPDGAPVAWLMRRTGTIGQARINGPDLMALYCESAAQRGESIYLYGSQQSTLDKLCTVLPNRYHGLKIAGSYSPPYRPLTQEEDDAAVASINASGASTVWVSLGCPKQEIWMAAHRGLVHAPMIGVGAAFDYHAGVILRAPSWMQNSGLEWFHRLCSEPQRLYKRYFLTNSLFILYAARQLGKPLLAKLRRTNTRALKP